MRYSNTLLSIITAALLATGCSSSGGSSEGTSSGNALPKIDVDQVISILNGNVDISAFSSSASSAFKAPTAASCADGGSVQVYAIDDTEYKTPLLKVAATINPTTCDFNITSSDFISSEYADLSRQFLIRSIILEGAKKIEVAALKLKEGSDAGQVDPVATMLKEKFANAIEELKGNMESLKSFGVTDEAIVAAVGKIVEDFSKNFDATLTQLSKDVDSGLVKLDDTDFETEDSIGDVLDPTKREGKVSRILDALDDSNVKDSLALIDSSIEDAQLKSLSITEDDLRGELKKGVAIIKYQVIAHFAKLGLPVHDGFGNIIMYMPVPSEQKGDLPGTIFKVDYVDDTDGSIGDDFAIRVINPKSDFSSVSGKEGWFKQYFEHGTDIMVPATAINAFIANKDHFTTLETLGQTIGNISNQGGVDAFAAEPKLYGLTMGSDPKASIKSIVDVYKRGFLIQSFNEIMFTQMDRIFREFDGAKPDASVIDRVLALPVVAISDSETDDAFLSRLGSDESETYQYVVSRAGESLARALTLSSDNAKQLQLKEGFVIANDSVVKPLAGIALTATYMEAQGGDGDITFEKVPLSDFFGWMLDQFPEKSGAFDGKYIWLINFGDSSASGEPAPIAAPALAPEEPFNNPIIELAQTLTGDTTIAPERNFDETYSALNEALNIIYSKQAGGDLFGFEDAYGGDFVDFAGAASVDASVSFALEDSNGSVTLNSNQSLYLYPVFENVSTFEQKPFLELNSSATFNTGRYEVSTLNVYNYDLIFDESATPSESGSYRFTGNFELRVVDENGSLPIAQFPIFPGENHLDYPFFYDPSGTFFEPTPGGIPGGAPAGEDVFLTASGEIFFPGIITASGEIVGENILHYDHSTQSLTTTTEPKGKLSDATLKINVIYSSYDDGNGTNSETTTFTNGVDGAGEGALLEVKISGSQVATQSVMVDIPYWNTASGDIELFMHSNNFTFPPVDMNGTMPPPGDMNLSIEAKALFDAVEYYVGFPPFNDANTTLTWRNKDDINTTVDFTTTPPSGGSSDGVLTATAVGTPDGNLTSITFTHSLGTYTLIDFAPDGPSAIELTPTGLSTETFYFKNDMNGSMPPPMMP